MQPIKFLLFWIGFFIIDCMLYALVKSSFKLIKSEDKKISNLYNKLMTYIKNFLPSSDDITYWIAFGPASDLEPFVTEKLYFKTLNISYPSCCSSIASLKPKSSLDLPLKCEPTVSCK